MGFKGTTFGWGINDVDYPTTKRRTLKGSNIIETEVCPYYRDWFGVLQRCLYPRYKERKPTYEGCTIDEEWKYLSNFIKWVDSQPNRDWKNCSLDKDMLTLKNKHYSSTNCVYIPKSLNSFIAEGGRAGSLMRGVTLDNRYKNPRYAAKCQNPFVHAGLGRHIGTYNTELEAHLAWQARKHEYACQLADLQQDPRVAKALRERYAPDRDWRY